MCILDKIYDNGVSWSFIDKYGVYSFTAGWHHSAQLHHVERLHRTGQRRPLREILRWQEGGVLSSL